MIDSGHDRPALARFIDKAQCIVDSEWSPDSLATSIADLIVELPPDSSVAERLIAREVLCRLAAPVVDRLDVPQEAQLELARCPVDAHDEFVDAFISCLRSWSSRAAGAAVPPCPPDDQIEDARVRVVLDTILERYADPAFHAAEAASRVNISRSHVSRLLKRHTGLGFGGWLRRARLDAARDLLLTPALPVKAVAYAVGYRHASDLDRAFRRAFGVSPTAYRRAGAAATAKRGGPGDGDDR